jgi:hypothetical protein
MDLACNARLKIFIPRASLPDGTACLCVFQRTFNSIWCDVTLLEFTLVLLSAGAADH